MAQVAVPEVEVSLDYGGGVKTFLTNSVGQWTYVAYMTEAEYNLLPSNFSIEAKKSGYTGTVVSVTKPQLAVTGSTMIQIDAVIAPIDPSMFSITPNVIDFGLGGGTVTITVTAPDNTWDFVFSDASGKVTVAKTDDTTLTITCATGGSPHIIGYVTWGEAELQFTVLPTLSNNV